MSLLGEIIDPEKRGASLLRAGALLHGAEIVFVLAALTVTTVSMLRADRSMIHFAVFWMLVCSLAAAVALWPRTPRLLHYIAESVLLAVALGQIVGPMHDVLPFLGRPLPNAGRWNDVPLTERRTMTWNILTAFVLTWLWPVACVLVYAVRNVPQEPARTIGALLVFMLVWCGLGLVFYGAIDAFLLG